MVELVQRLSQLTPAKRRLLEQALALRPDLAEPVAIVGMACRFPGAADLDAYWQLCERGDDRTGEIPKSRWDIDEFYDPTGEQPGKMSTRWAGLIDDVDQFDPLFFGVTPREAVSIDPQQRLLLEVAWEALETATLAPDRMAGSNTGVFIGIGGTDYAKIPAQFANYYERIDAHVGTGNALSVAANRISYVLDLRGPSLALDTACSSAMVALHCAIQSLRNRECDAALAGGVNLILTPETTIAFSKARMLSPDGRCRPFDAAANGYVRGEGCGLVVLKRLVDAAEAGDRILAVIRNSAVNQDGRTSGITAPNGTSQQAVIRAALAKAGLSPDQVTYIEAHGTGTPLGDPIELQALAEVFRRGSAAQPPCYVGSVKANIGHTETASGIAGLIKVVLMMQHSRIPAQTHFQALNPNIRLDGSRIEIPAQGLAWETHGQPRIAGVSSFGFGGTNAHLLLEQAGAVAGETGASTAADRPRHLLTLSARSDAALRALAGRYAQFLRDHPDASLADLCHSAGIGRSQLPHRLAVPVADRDGLCEELQQVAAGERPGKARTAQVPAAARPRVAFVFTGQGSQYVGMARTLYETQPTFRRVLEECDELLAEYLDEPLLRVLYPDDARPSPLDETIFTQPALFALEVALAQLWRSWGVEPSVVLGHSIGEYAAAAVAGVFSLEDGLRLVVDRARLMQQLPPDGAMQVVFADVRRVESALAGRGDELAVAAINGPENTVISGRAESVRDVAERFEREGVRTQPLVVSHAFHSPLMDPMLDEFERLAGEARFAPPQVPLISNLTGSVVDGRLMDAGYWRQHVRQPVEFARSVEQLARHQVNAVLEIGPSTSLLAMGRRAVPSLQALWLPSLRRGQDDWSVLLNSLIDLYLAGARIDWAGFDRHWPRQRLSLPTYPFQRSRNWFDATGARRRLADHSAAADPPSGASHALLGERLAVAVPMKVFQARLASSRPACLADHQVDGSAVVPAAAYLEQALAAAEQLFGPGAHPVENVSIQQAMFLPPGSERVVQVALVEDAADQSTFSTSSVPVGPPPEPARPWTLHARGQIRRQTAADKLPPLPPALLDEVRQRVVDVKSADEFYALMAQRSLAYGTTFRVLDRLERTDNEAVAELKLPEAVRAHLDDYHLHPALLDGLFQAMACVVPLEDDGSYSPATYLPTAVRRLRVAGRPAGTLRVVAVRRWPSEGPSPEAVEGDVRLVDADGRVFVELEGVRIERMGRAAAGSRDKVDPAQWLYRLDWQPLPDPPADVPADSPPAGGNWLVLADRRGVARGLVERLERRGARCAVVGADGPDGPGGANDSSWTRIDPLDPDACATVLQEAAQRLGPLDGVVDLWSLDAPEPGDPGMLHEARRLGCAAALQLVRAMARMPAPRPAGLWLVTRGAQQVLAETRTIEPAQASLWGFGRVAALEFAELECRLIDLDPQSDPRTSADQLAERLARRDHRLENQLALRGGRWYVPRLAPAAELAPRPAAAELPHGPFRLELDEPGSIDSLRFRPAHRQPPGADQVEVEVHAAGVNFSDVLKALGLYPGITDRIVPLGIEASGVVTAVGERVGRLRPGDAVMGVVPYSLASHAVTAEYALVPKPPEIDHAQAASIPITFLTAWYALRQLARLQPGERVLIHAAAGGVGLAAVQIARQAGAELFATAGSDEKRDFLRSLGVRHVYNSRTLDFAEQIRGDTGGRGVDVVLNSLPGEAIERSLELLEPYGRFLEIGKTDIYQNRMIGLRPFRDNLSYFAIDLDRLLRQRPDAVRQLLAELMDEFSAGRLQPLPLTEFAAQRVVDALRYMAQRKNIGKVVVRVAPASDEGRDAAEGRPERAAAAGRSLADQPPSCIRREATYLVTGGFGALGRRVAEWLADRGARSLALLARREPSAAARPWIEQLESQGVRVAVLQADVADARALDAALARLPADFPPLSGVFHAAGTLDDGMLFDMDLAQLDRAMAPKVAGAWNLHLATRAMPLDWFVLFSSVAGLIGSPGQANYAAGNAFLDALAEFRQGLGLPATSIAWGPWGQSGMAADAAVRDGLDARGMRLITPDAGLALLERLLAAPAATVTAVDARWDELVRWLPGGRPALLERIVGEQSAPAESGASGVDQRLRAQLLDAQPEERIELLGRYLASQLSQIMGVDEPTLDADQPLGAMGLDSLMALELKNKLERQLDFNLPMAVLFEGPSIRRLAESVAAELAGSPPTDGPAEGAAGPAQPAAQPPTAGGASRAADAWSPLVKLTAPTADRSHAAGQPQAAAAHLFCLHPLGGDTRCYDQLARQLPDDLAVYALRARGAEGTWQPHRSLERMVADYFAAIERLAPRGPYRLAGWSAGGIYAYELARHIQQSGARVESLVLIDTPLPSIYDHVDLDDDARFLADLVDFTNRFTGSSMLAPYDQWAAMAPDERFEAALDEARRHGVVPPDVAADHIRRLVDVARENVRLIMSCAPQPLPQPATIHLVRPADRGVLAEASGQQLADDLGWSRILGERFTLHEVPGDHFTMMTVEDGEPLARCVERCLGLQSPKSEPR